MTTTLHDNYSIIPHPDHPQILFLREEDGWTLPRHQATMAHEINATMQAHPGLTTTVLECVYDRYKDPERGTEHLVYALENHSPDIWTPANGRWVGQEELANLSLAVPEHRAVLEEWLTRAAHPGQDGKYAAWTQPGWFGQASTWIQEQLERLGYALAAPIEQLTALPWGTVLRVPTTTDLLFFKAPSADAAFEPALAQTLAHFVPGSVPQVCALDVQRHWLFMKDGGTPLRTSVPDPARSAEALRQFAQMQIALVPHIEALKATGCPDQRSPALLRLYEEVLATPSLLLLEQPKGLSSDEYQRLLAFTPQLRAMCEELDSYSLPVSLSHDDLHTRNILHNGEHYVFIDAGEYCLGHPFCSMFVVLREARYVQKYDEQTREQLCQAYLEPWTYVLSMEQLQRALVLAHRLGALYRALSWSRLLSPIEPERRGKHEDATLYFLQVFLGTQE